MKVTKKKPTHDSGGKGNMEILFSQYQGRKGFQENKKFVEQMDIK